MNFSEDKININLEFSRIKLLGYYDKPLNTTITEVKYLEEAEIMSELLDKSFNSIECIKTIDSDYRAELMNSELIFKNTQGKLLAFYAPEGVVILTDVKYNADKIKKPSNDIQCYFTPGEPFIPFKLECGQVEGKREITKVKANVIDIIKIDGFYHYKLSYAGCMCYVKLLPFEVQFLENTKHKKILDCVYHGLDNDGNPRLVQDRESYIDDLYEKDTVQKFTYVNTAYEHHGNETKEFHWVQDSYGLKHRFYGELSEEQKMYRNELELYIKRIDPRTKKLSLTIYNPNLDPIVKEWYSADRIFKEIEETDNKEQYFDIYFSNGYEFASKLEKDLVGQYNGQSNLWLFTYLNILDNELAGCCIRKHKVEELAIVSQIMIKLQEWMVEKSAFLDLFSEDTKNDTIIKSTYQIQKYQRILLAIDVVRKGEQLIYINDIVNSIKSSGRIAIRREERIEVLLYILRIYPEYIIQDIESTSHLIQALLQIEEGVNRYFIENIISLLNYYIEYNTRKIRKTTVRTNDIDTSQTLLIKEILSLLGFKILIYKNEMYLDEIQCREAKARFFRFLSFICIESMQSTVLKAAIDSLVGILNDSEIFTYDNLANINVISLTKLTANAAVLDCNLDNDYYFKSGKSGILSLDPTGFTIVPYKQCITTLIQQTTSLEGINVIHNLETLPLKLGTMYNFKSIMTTNNPIEQYLIWNGITRDNSKLEKVIKPQPKIGDVVKIMVKEQNQNDRLKFMVFVTVIDNRYQSVEGVILVNQISSKWIVDARKIFNPGDVFYATVCSDNGKYNFSIKEEVDKYSTIASSATDDARNIVLNKSANTTDKQLPKGFIQELILLVDMRIRKETDTQSKLTLIGYAYCLSALVGDPKSYYYDFLLRYFACIEKFVTESYQEISIPISSNIEKYFKGLSSKIHLIELLSLTESTSEEGLQSLSSLAANERNNDVGKIASMLLTYLYAQKANLSYSSLNAIKTEINTFIGNSDNLDLTALDSSKEDNHKDILDADDIEEIDETSNKIDPLESSSDCVNNTDIELDNNTRVNSFVPIKLNILDNSSVVVNEAIKNINYETSVLEIYIKDYAKEGFLLIVNNQGWICKIPVISIVESGYGAQIEKCINPYKLSNHFVVPADCIIGLIITADTGKYIELWHTSEIPSSKLNNIEYEKSRYEKILRHQAFILPSNNVMNEYCNKSIKDDMISLDIKDVFESYGIFI